MIDLRARPRMPRKMHFFHNHVLHIAIYTLPPLDTDEWIEVVWC